jgi:hypothetical protein
MFFVLSVLSMFCFASMHTSAQAATITVNGGGQSAIVNALNQAKPGDTISVAAGNYDDNSSSALRITKSGTASAPMMLKSAEKHKAKLGNIEFNASYFILDGFEITPATPYKTSYNTITLDGGKSVIIRNMKIHHVRQGINVQEGSDHTIENSMIYENINTDSSNNEVHSIIILHAKNTIVRGNTLYGAVGDSVQLYKPKSESPLNRGTTLIENNKMANTRQYCAENAIDIKGELGTVIVRGNIMSGYRFADPDNKSGKNPGGCDYAPTGSTIGNAIVAHEGASGLLRIEQNEFYDMESALTAGGMQTIFQNNILHDFVEQQPLWGVGGREYIGALTFAPQVSVYHNTFVNIPWLSHTFANSGRGAKVSNNIFYNVKHTPPDNDYSYNAWFGNSERRAGTGDVTSGTLRLNFTTYNLESNSSLIDKAKNLNINQDFNVGIRPVGSAPDIGADEYGNGGGGVNSGSSSSGRPNPPQSLKILQDNHHSPCPEHFLSSACTASSWPPASVAQQLPHARRHGTDQPGLCLDSTFTAPADGGVG